jgi:CARDB
LSNDAFIDASDTLLATFSTPQLLANQSSNGSFTATIPGNLLPGTYNIIVAADTANVVTNEISETNNVLAQSFTVTALPDLDLYDNLTVSNTMLPAGASTTLSYYVVNFGQASVGSSVTGFYLSSDNTITTSDTLLTTRTAPSLGPDLNQAGAGWYDLESMTVTLPGNLAPGTYYLGAIADYNSRGGYVGAAINIGGFVRLRSYETSMLATRICMLYSHTVPCIDEPCLGLLGAEP